MLFHEVATKALQNRQRMKTYRNAKSFKRWEQVVSSHLLPSLGQVDVNEIDSDLIVTVLTPLWMTSTPTATFTRAVLDYILGYAIHRHWRTADYNPAKWKDCLSFDLPPSADIHAVKHHEALTIGEAQRIMPALMTSTKVGELATAFGILTACRSSEYTQAKWSEIDFDKRVLNVPIERCKVKRTEPFQVPLSDQAIDILSKVRNDSDYVFLSKITGEAITSFVPRQVMRRKLPNHAGITAHGNRSAFSTWCAETGKDPVLREMCLMHVQGNAVANAYNHSNVLDQRRLLMQQWADAIYHA